MVQLPAEFVSLTDSFVDEDAGVVLARLDRGLKKLLPTRDSRSPEERLAAAKQLVSKTRLRPSTSSLHKSLQHIVTDQSQHERDAIYTSADEVDRYVDAAGQSFASMMKAAEHQENVAEWEGWDEGLKVRASMFREELLEVQSGKKAVKSGLGALDFRKEVDVSRKELVCG